MKIKRLFFLIGCFVGLAVAILGTYLKTYFLPVGDINGKQIYFFQVKPYSAGIQSNAVKNFAKDKTFFEAMSSLGITVPEKTVEDEYQKYIERYGGEDEFKSILLDTTQSIDSVKNSIRRSILQQKAISYFAEKASPTEDEMQKYFNENLGDFPKEYEQEKDEVRQAVMAQQGEKAYNEYMQQSEQGIVIRVY